MYSYRKTAIVVGVLFITATVTAILTLVLLGSILDAPDYLTKVADSCRFGSGNWGYDVSGPQEV
jgi:hypothetical protein